MWVPQPEFEGQTKTRLGNPEVRRVVESVIGEQVSEHLEFYPNTLGSIFSKASQAQKAAEAAKRARELVRRKSVLRSGSLPGKLSDCSSSDPESSDGTTSDAPSVPYRSSTRTTPRPAKRAGIGAMRSGFLLR